MERVHTLALFEAGISMPGEMDELAKLTGASKDKLQAEREKSLSEGKFLASLRDLEELGPAGEAAAKQIVRVMQIGDLNEKIEERCVALITQKIDAKLEPITTQIIDQPVTPNYGDKKPVTMRELIGLYGDNLQGLVPRYLEAAMASFTQQQDQMRDTMTKTMGGFMPFPGAMPNLEEVSKQNMAMMERALSLFTPFARREENTGANETERLRGEIEILKRELDALRQRAKG
jgi:polyhydroxyalkanoate synthesis regulator protein